MNISTYLTFNGNCREAMLFYRECLGGELSLQTVGESPLSEQLPEHFKSYIVQATLLKDQFRLVASDMVGEKGLRKGNAISMLLECNSEKEIIHCYERLARGGKKTHPLEHTCRGALTGDLTDKYGHNWLLHFQEKEAAVQ